MTIKKLNKTMTAVGIILGVGTFFFLSAVAEQDPNTAFQRMRLSVVRLQKPGVGGGTGFLVETPKGKVTITNWHVCEIGSDTGVLYADRAGEFEDVKTKILETDPAHDLCVLEAVPGLPLPVAHEGPPQVFSPIYILGHPYLHEQTPSKGNYDGEIRDKIGFDVGKDGKCAEGSELKVSGFGEVFCVREFILGDTNVPIFPGNSGSPVTDSGGNVVGVANSSDGRTHYAGFIPLRFLKLLLSRY